MEQDGTVVANANIDGDSEAMEDEVEKDDKTTRSPTYTDISSATAAAENVAATDNEIDPEADATGSKEGGSFVEGANLGVAAEHSEHSEGTATDGVMFDGDGVTNSSGEIQPTEPDSSSTRPVQRISSSDDTKPDVPLARTEADTNSALKPHKVGVAEPVSGSMPGVEEETSSEGLRKALVGFYSVHNPGRISTLDVILAQYRGKEDLLIERLEQKYSADLSYARRAAGMQSRRTTASSTLPPATTVPSVDVAASTNTSSSPNPKVNTSHSLSPQLSHGKSQAGAAASSSDLQKSQRGSETIRGAARSSGPYLGTSALQTASNTSGGASSNYMIYLADQLISNVETLLPSSNSGNPPTSSSEASSNNGRMPKNGSRSMGVSGDGGASRFQRHATLGPSHWSSKPNTSTASGEPGAVSEGDRAESTVGHDRAVDAALARVRVLEEERASFMATCRRLQGKAEAAAREAAATEELREAGQRKLAGFTERAAAAERQAREAAVRLRALESMQAALQAEKEASVRRCAAKHTQLLSAIDLQMALRSQLEGLLEIVPPSSTGRKLSIRRNFACEGQDKTPGGEKVDTDSLDASNNVRDKPSLSTEVGDVAGRGSGNNDEKVNERKMGDLSSAGNSDGGAGDESGGGGLDEVKRRCSLLEVSLKASRQEASEARRARDAAERTVRDQRATLTELRTKISDLETAFSREKGSGQVALDAAQRLEADLSIRLRDLRDAEAKLVDQSEENARLCEEARGSAARLQNASAARAALLAFCRQERRNVELEAAEYVARAEANAAMRGEEGLARGLELVRMAEEAGEKRATVDAQEIDRLGKALFSARAELAGSEAREQTLRKELGRAAETIAGLSAIENHLSTGTASAAEERKEDSGLTAATSRLRIAGESNRDQGYGPREVFESPKQPRLLSPRADAGPSHARGGEERVPVATGSMLAAVGEATRWAGEIPRVNAGERRNSDNKTAPVGNGGYDVEL